MPRKSTNDIKKLRDTARPDRVKPSIEAKSISPAPDADLDDVARAEWMRVSQAMKVHSLIKDLDAAILSAYATNFSRWKQAEYSLMRDGLVVLIPVRDAHGKISHEVPRKNPMLAVSESAQRLLSKFADQLGLSPSGRSRLGVESPKPKSENEDDEFAEFPQ